MTKKIAILFLFVTNISSYVYSCDLSTLRCALIHKIQEPTPFPHDNKHAKVRYRRMLQECERLERHSYKTIYEKQIKAAKNRYKRLVVNYSMRTNSPVINDLLYKTVGLNFVTLKKHDEQRSDNLNYDKSKIARPVFLPNEPPVSYEIISFLRQPLHRFVRTTNQNDYFGEMVSVSSCDNSISTITATMQPLTSE